jgi:hypothetical protein
LVFSSDRNLPPGPAAVESGYNGVGNVTEETSCL